MPRAKLLEYGTEQRPREGGLAVERTTQGAGKRVGVQILLEVPTGPRVHRLQKLVLVWRVRDQNELGLGHPCGDPAGRSDPATGQIRVDEAKRRPLSQSRPHRLGRVGSLRADLEPVALEDQANAGPRRKVRVGNEDARRFLRHCAPAPTAGVGVAEELITL